MDRAWSGHRRIGTGAAAIAAAAAVAGCSTIAPLTDQIQASAHEVVEASHLTPLGVNPSSPIAADALKAEQVEGPVPSFASVPPKPTDVRPAQAYKAEVVTLVADKRNLNQWSNANPPGVVDAAASEHFAESGRQRVGNEPAVTAEKQGETDAFARKGRQAVGQSDAPPPAKSPS